MSKVTIVGNAVIVTSAIKLEDIKSIKKYRPDALILSDEDGEPRYAVSVTDGPGSISRYGASFGSVTRDGEGKGQITLALDASEDIDDVKEYIADKLGGSLALLNELEEKLPAVVEQIAAQKAAVMDSITVC